MYMKPDEFLVYLAKNGYELRSATLDFGRDFSFVLLGGALPGEERVIRIKGIEFEEDNVNEILKHKDLIETDIPTHVSLKYLDGIKDFLKSVVLSLKQFDPTPEVNRQSLSEAIKNTVKEVLGKTGSNDVRRSVHIEIPVMLDGKEIDRKIKDVSLQWNIKQDT